MANADPPLICVLCANKNLGPEQKFQKLGKKGVASLLRAAKESAGNLSQQ